MNDALLSVDDARARILAGVDVVGDETVSLPQADGRVLAEALSSKRDIPAFDNSAMDGVGVRAVDVAVASSAAPVRLAIAGWSLPGGADAVALGAGQAVRIMTGAPVPPGVDAIVMRELTDESGITDVSGVAGGFVLVKDAAPLGQHVRKRGEDVAEGDVVARAGDVVTPARLNLLLSAGHATARVRRRPVVGVLASGDELREVGLPYGPKDVINSNAHAVASAARALGCDVHLLGIAKDNLDDHVKRIESGLFCDAIVTIGGVSMGTHDFTRPALDKIGAVVELWRVAMRPGKPVAYARKNNVRIFGLPGNPVSALVSFELFVRPALRKMSGLAGTTRPLFPAVLVDSELKKKPGLETWARASVRSVDGKLHARVLDKQGSHHISVLAQANGLVRFPAALERAIDGDVVDVMLLDDPLTRADMW